MWAIGLLLAGIAWAEEGTDVEVQAGVDDQGIYEVRVYGPDAVVQARKAVVREMEALGWLLVDRRDGVMIFRGPRGWMGRALINGDGSLAFTTPTALLQGGSPEAVQAARGPSAQRLLTVGQMSQGRFPGLDTPTDAAATGLEPDAVSVTIATGPGRAKAEGVQDDVVVGIDGALDRYREAMQETAFQARLEEVSGRLDALWELGEPLEPGGPRIEDVAARRAVALDYWASRADTPEGQRVCEVVERWLVEVVMASDAPVTTEETAAAVTAALATHGRPLALR